MASDLPAEVQDFITRYIVSVEELEVLLLLHGEKDRDWSVGEIDAQLRSQEASIAKWLEVLVASRLVAVTHDRYVYAPRSEELRLQTDALAEAYRARRIKVIEFIFSKPNENLLGFARAFDLRKRP